MHYLPCLEDPETSSNAQKSQFNIHGADKGMQVAADFPPGFESGSSL